MAAPVTPLEVVDFQAVHLGARSYVFSLDEAAVGFGNGKNSGISAQEFRVPSEAAKLLGHLSLNSQKLI